MITFREIAFWVIMAAGAVGGIVLFKIVVVEGIREILQHRKANR